MSEKLMQSYVWHNGKCFFISTISRDCSAMLAYGHRYAETIVWECDPETRELGRLIGQEEGVEGTIDTHVAVCRRLHETGSVLERTLPHHTWRQ